MSDDIRLVLPFKSLELVSSHDVVVNLGPPEQTRKLIKQAFKDKGIEVNL